MFLWRWPALGERLVFAGGPWSRAFVIFWAADIDYYRLHRHLPNVNQHNGQRLLMRDYQYVDIAVTLSYPIETILSQCRITSQILAQNWHSVGLT